MATLVTGGAGYIGSHTAKLLHQQGERVILFDNFSRGSREATQDLPVVEGDLRDYNVVLSALRAHQIRRVIHFAALAYVGESVSHPDLYFDNNVVGSISLLRAMREIGIDTIVFSSTCSTYGVPGQIPIREVDPQRPVNPYGETKVVVERALKWFGAAYEMKWVALRYFNAAGADIEGQLGERHNPETHLIPRAIQAVLRLAPPLEVFGTDYPTRDGTASRDYVHVSDLAAGHIAALRYLDHGGPSAAFNLGTGLGHTVFEVMAEIERASGSEVPRRLCPRRAGDPPELVADPRKAREVLRWVPIYSDLRTIVGTAWKWHHARMA